MKAIALATVASIAVQPLVFGVWFFLPLMLEGASIAQADALGISMFVLLVATPFVIVLGIPIFLILRKYHRAHWLSVSLAGAAIGSVTYAMLDWPAGSRWSGFSSGGNWHGRHVDFYVSGVATSFRWLSYAESIVEFALQGFIGALVFYLVWSTVTGSNYRIERAREP